MPIEIASIYQAKLISDNKILVAGKVYNKNTGAYDGHIFSYDINTGKFTKISNINIRNCIILAMNNDETLIIPDNSLWYSEEENQEVKLYNIKNNEIWDIGTTADGSDKTATLLSNGKILLTGGNIFRIDNLLCALNTEIFDINTGKSVESGVMPVARSGHVATTLKNGDVLITGGINTNSIRYINVPILNKAAEIYIPEP